MRRVGGPINGPTSSQGEVYHDTEGLCRFRRSRRFPKFYPVEVKVDIISIDQRTVRMKASRHSLAGARIPYPGELFAIGVPDMNNLMSNLRIDSIFFQDIDFGNFGLRTSETAETVQPESRPNSRPGTRPGARPKAPRPGWSGGSRRQPLFPRIDGFDRPLPSGDARRQPLPEAKRLL